MKKCSDCCEMKPFADFSKKKQGRFGLNPRCRLCDALWQRKRRRRLNPLTLSPGDRYSIVCSACQETVEVVYQSGPRKRRCEPCVTNAARNRAREKYRAADLKKKYGITIADFDRILESQGGRCAICRTDEPGGRHSTWHVDHCHDSGQVRALLCQGCNIGIGCFRDDPRFLRAAAEYVERHHQLRLVV